MIARIRELIDKRKHNEAYELVKQELKKKFNLHNEEDELIYSELLALNTTVKTLLGASYDDLILDAVRRKKFNSQKKYKIDNVNVFLTDENLLLSDSETYINIIHDTKYFNFSDRSASDAFIKRLGQKHIDTELEKHTNLKRGDYIKIKHPSLKAQYSFHILALFGNNNQLDFEAMEKSLSSILIEMEQMDLKKISMPAIGFDWVYMVPDEQKEQVATSIADKVAEVIVTTIKQQKFSAYPDIHIKFVASDTKEAFTKAFYHWSKMDDYYFKNIIHFQENQKKLIKEAKTNNPNYIKLLNEISNAFREDSIVLLLGETGTGKSFFAEQIHKYSARSAKPFESFNCALLKQGKNYTQLFGWVKGSYTGADKDGVGLIEKAEGGTLFLDEVGNLDLESQKSLLLFLDKGLYRRYGDPNQRQADVRLLFGTNQNLERRVKKHLFAHDLFERIAGRVYTLLPLRYRKDDIEIFTKWLVNSFNKKKNQSVVVDSLAINELMKYSWPGNVRQLQYYLQNLYHNSIYNESFKIDVQNIRELPPRDSLFEEFDRFEELENILESFLKDWNSKKGKFTEEFINPILAKIYKENINGNIRETDKFLGITGSSGKQSEFNRSYAKFAGLEEIYKSNYID
ncbi:MAG: hypothetical protein D8M58_21760 [Calditrichaeota bacterium]|nr:MAG: hypothetical protein DWQ03_00715 [Calditrichota bacterium]MBL1208042.1 hypothetical protein [Calditrichota bacterium]NOG47877.1 sigma 54-interacting transcriptional regulator [Calditrichota bacterium]